MKLRTIKHNEFKDYPDEGFVRSCGWMVDFLRAAAERPRAWRWLLRLCLGRYAYREFIGMVETARDAKFYPVAKYGLEGKSHHEVGILGWDWVEYAAGEWVKVDTSGSGMA